MYTTILALGLAPLALAGALPKRDLAPASGAALPSGWEYSGCYTDDRNHRSLSSDFYFDSPSNLMTAASCISYCSSKGYPVAGTEYSGECYCGPLVPQQSGTTGCSMACSGDSNQACGGPDRLTVYSSFHTNPGPTGWTSQGCYTDSVQARTLSNLEQVPGGTDAMTVAACTTKCGSLGFSYAGLEYAGECFCGNTLNNGATPFAGGCGMLCKGDNTEFCGGPDRLNLYAATTTPA
ncbi:WSC-domain-containing protein [Polyplosphaeria fusca]|uniref:WSC-domain-containing protein n=1 Tax=Polyplosphaeria fusca TaxID=682080 RepID=A0A9P4UWL1_9PLEO|nr:WSC-domain-containing protein [Polyplosphaeria fusca]